MMRLQPLILQGSVSKGTTKSVGASISFSNSFHDEFSGGAGPCPALAGTRNWIRNGCTQEQEGKHAFTHEMVE